MKLHILYLLTNAVINTVKIHISSSRPNNTDYGSIFIRVLWTTNGSRSAKLVWTTKGSGSAKLAWTPKGSGFAKLAWTTKGSGSAKLVWPTKWYGSGRLVWVVNNADLDLDPSDWSIEPNDADPDSQNWSTVPNDADPDPLDWIPCQIFLPDLLWSKFLLHHHYCLVHGGYNMSQTPSPLAAAPFGI